MYNRIHTSHHSTSPLDLNQMRALGFQPCKNVLQFKLVYSVFLEELYISQGHVNFEKMAKPIH